MPRSRSCRPPSLALFLWLCIGAAVFCVLSCTKEIMVYPEPSPQPTPENYLFISSYLTCTERFAGTDTIYYPHFQQYCSNKSSPRQIASVTAESPWSNYLWMEPHYTFHPEGGILQVRNAHQFPIDSSFKTLYYWCKVRLFGNCVTLGSGFAPAYQFPDTLVHDTTIQIREVWPNGTVKFLVNGEPRYVAVSDSFKLFAKLYTTTISDLDYETGESIHRDVVGTDTMVICNHGFLPKKLILFEYDGDTLRAKP